MMGASFVVRVREALEPLPGVARVDVELEHDSGWSPADLDEGYARRLEEARVRARSAADRRKRGEGPAGYLSGVFGREAQ
jgi:hypothetical protein